MFRREVRKDGMVVVTSGNGSLEEGGAGESWVEHS